MSFDLGIANEMLSEARDIITEKNTSKSMTDAPRLIILGGQPGSGKSSAIELIESEYNKNVVAINGDDFKPLYPDYNLKMQHSSEKTSIEVQPYSNHVVNALKAEYSDKKYNLIIEGTMRTSDIPLSTVSEMKAKGYKAEAYVVAANYYASRTGCLLRMETDKFNTGIGRPVPVDSHDAAYANIPATIKTLVDSGMLDNLKVLTRDGKVIGDLSQGHDVVSIYTAHRNQMDKLEFKQVNDDLTKVLSMMKDRNASVADISQVANLQTQLKLNHGIDQTVKANLMEFLDKEINRSTALENQVRSITHKIGDKFELTNKVNNLTDDLKDFCTKNTPSVKANLEQQEIVLKPQFGQSLDHKAIQQRLASNQLNQNDMYNLVRGMERRMAVQTQQISLSQGKGVKL